MTRLSVRSRVLTALAAALLAATFFVPLWRIELLAPQYPEGLGMLIRVNTITGIAPTDLGNINGLNHYIGMKAIVPDAIPVLRYMPWVLGVLVIGGLAVAVAGRRPPLLAWIGALGLAGAAGLAEFYRWSYDYGHNLAADAVIKVPGMTYQPPLIGTKQLLNFTASSWPDIGGWLAAAAFALAVVALLPWIRAGAAPRVTSASRMAAVVWLGLLSSVAASCARTAGPVPIEYGRADCAVCRMRITDDRYGGEFVAATGKVRQFDSIECLADYVASLPVAAPGVAYVSDYEHPGHLLAATGALFVRRLGSGSPMGAGLLAVRADADTASLRTRVQGDPLTWAQVRTLAARHELRPRREPAAAGDAS